jgi:adenosylcobinamide-phosphate synthase
VADALSEALSGNPVLLAAAIAIDLAIGDPAYRFHPIRLIGGSLSAVERVLRRLGADGYAGGILLFVALALLWADGTVALLVMVGPATWIGWALHLFVAYSLLAFGDLLRHVWRVERAAGRDDLDAARAAVANLVGRDTNTMDASACRRAAIESLGESLTDGFTSPLFWYALLGLPGLVLFKVVSTMDSMVGYRTPRYLRFGWCGARLDDAMNFVPARVTWLLLAAVAAILPRQSGRKAFTIGLAQHARVPGPNAGWSEAATAGAIERRLVGPIWLNGVLVTEQWIGDPTDPPASTGDDVRRALVLATVTGLVAAAIVCASLWFVH